MAGCCKTVQCKDVLTFLTLLMAFCVFLDISLLSGNLPDEFSAKAKLLNNTRVLIATDSYPPHVSGVARKCLTFEGILESRNNVSVAVIHPSQYLYTQIWYFPLTLPSFSQISKGLRSYDPDLVVVATPGPIGLFVTMACWWNNYKYVSMFSTRLHEYMRANIGGVLGWVGDDFMWAYLKWFHSSSEAVIVPSDSTKGHLAANNPGFKAIITIANGCNTTLFHHKGKKNAQMLKWKEGGPVYLYVGRVAIEKNMVEFAELPVEGTKVIVGRGPYLTYLKTNYPDVKYMGWKYGEELAEIYRSADIFVFPSKWDTFGQVMVEAMASGIPVAGYDVIGPKDVVVSGETGVLHPTNLTAAVEETLKQFGVGGNCVACRQHAEKFSWDEATNKLLETTKYVK